MGPSPVHNRGPHHHKGGGQGPKPEPKPVQTEPVQTGPTPVQTGPKPAPDRSEAGRKTGPSKPGRVFVTSVNERERAPRGANAPRRRGRRRLPRRLGAAAARARTARPHLGRRAIKEREGPVVELPAPPGRSRPKTPGLSRLSNTHVFIWGPGWPQARKTPGLGRGAQARDFPGLGPGPRVPKRKNIK
jgi:hypothetical protein